MKNGFYTRIALENVKKNGRLYWPRILAEAGLLGCFYILITLAMDGRLSEALGGAYLPTFMWMGAAVLGLLSLILLLYVNSFLMKRRQSEYGLYNVLEDTLTPHTPDYYSTVQLAVTYDKKADCPLFKKFLMESMDGTGEC